MLFSFSCICGDLAWLFLVFQIHGLLLVTLTVCLFMHSPAVVIGLSSHFCKALKKMNVVFHTHVGVHVSSVPGRGRLILFAHFLVIMECAEFPILLLGYMPK